MFYVLRCTFYELHVGGGTRLEPSGGRSDTSPEGGGLVQASLLVPGSLEGSILGLASRPVSSGSRGRHLDGAFGPDALHGA